MDRKAERVKRLREMIPYLKLENNWDALKQVKEELHELCGEIIAVNEPAAQPGLERAYESMIYHLIDENDFESAKRRANEGLERLPYSRILLYLLASAKKGQLYRFEVDGDESYTREEKLVVALKQLARDYDVLSGDSEIQHRIYCALGEYGEARAHCEIVANHAANFGRYDEAIEWYRRGLDFDMAEKMMAEKPIYDRFAAEVGEPRYYLLNRLSREEPEMLDEHEQLCKMASQGTKAKSWLCVIAFAVSFAVSLLFDFELGLDKGVVAIVFSIFFALGVSLMSDKGFKIGRTLGLVAATFFLTAMFYKNMFWQLIPVLSKMPEGLAINLVSFLVAGIHLVRKIKALPAERAARRMTDLSKVFEAKCARYKKELFDRYGPQVGSKRVEGWTYWMRIPSEWTL